MENLFIVFRFNVLHEKIAVMQTVINDLLTNYKEYGASNDQGLLILHGWGCSLSDWEKAADKLSRSYHVFLLDLPGFGGSVKPKKDFDIYDYADFVANFMKKKHITNCILLGHSFGGRIGIILGSRNILLNKLVLVDSAGIERISRLYKVFLTLVKIVSSVLPKKAKTFVTRLMSSDDYSKAGEMKKIFKNVVNEDLTYLLDRIKIRTLIIWGSADKILDVKNTKVFKKHIPNSLVRIVWGAGHHPHIEKEDIFIEILKEFLDA